MSFINRQVRTLLLMVTAVTAAGVFFGGAVFAGDGGRTKSEWRVAGGQGSGWLLAGGNCEKRVETCLNSCSRREDYCLKNGKWSSGGEVADCWTCCSMSGSSYWSEKCESDFCEGHMLDCIEKCNSICEPDSDSDSDYD
jgi:hypothetical protein